MTGSSFLSRLQSWLPLLPLLVLLAGTYWLNQQVLPLPPKPDASKRHDPDYILDNFAAMTLNDQGAPSFLMDAQKMEHYPDNDATLLYKPHMFSLFANSPPVSITAGEGEISRDGETVTLRDSVKIVRNASARQSEMVVDTNRLRVIPKQDLAETGSPITLRDAHTWISAVGMEFNYRTRELKLLSQVRSRHDPEKN